MHERDEVGGYIVYTRVSMLNPAPPPVPTSSDTLSIIGAEKVSLSFSFNDCL